MNASTSESRAAAGNKYLTFALAGEEYGLSVQAVREILACPRITPVPRAPDYIRGVINLRGQVVTVMDLRARFNMPTAEHTRLTCIIVVETASAGRRAFTGLLVDRVAEVLDIAPANIDPAPAWDDSASNDFVIGLGKVGPAVKILLNPATVVGAVSNLEAKAA